MARWEIEPSGCCEHKGMVQVRFCFYLAPGDARYSEHRVNLPVFPSRGYPGKKDELGAPKSDQDHKAWLDTLPREWQTNPFHNHFIYVDPETTDEEIAAIGDELLEVIYTDWLLERKPGRGTPKPVFPKNVTSEMRSLCTVRAREMGGRHVSN